MALVLVRYLIIGALDLYTVATDNGFLGLLLYVAAWGLFWFVMIPVCIVRGIAVAAEKKDLEK